MYLSTNLLIVDEKFKEVGIFLLKLNTTVDKYLSAHNEFQHATRHSVLILQ